MMPPCARATRAPGRRRASAASTARATRAASARLGVIENGARVGVVLGLRDEIRGDPASRTSRRDDDDLGRAGVEIDAAVGGDERLRGRDVAVARADDLVHARHRLRCRRPARRSHVRRRRGTAARRRLRAPLP